MSAIENSANEKKALVRRLVDAVLNGADPGAADHLLEAGAAARLAAATAPVRAAFPDFRYTVESVLGEDDVVVCLGTWSGTHHGEYLGVAPTGRTVGGRRTDTFRLAAGKVVESRSQWDPAAALRAISPPPAPADTPAEWEEPVLETAEIQGDVLPGLERAHSLFLFYQVEDAERMRAWLGRILPRVTSCARVLAAHERGGPAGCWVNLAFTFEGLRRLAPGAERFAEPAFREGMHRRSTLLGDPGDPVAPGCCGRWVVGAPHAVPHLLLRLAGDTPEEVEAAAFALAPGASDGARPLFRQAGAVLPGELAGHEHFGFRDNVSQPGVRGRVSPGGALYTPRADPAAPHQGMPGQNVVWPGEFVFGYPAQDPTDLVRPGPVADAGPAWGRNGSFLVLRRLRQDVGAYRAFVRRAAAELRAASPALAGLTAEGLEARLMGRWHSGAPVARAPVCDDPELAADLRAVNHFGYAGEAAPHPAACPVRPPALADPLGLLCPHAAHVRRAYPRDDPTSNVSRAAIETHRILRRSVPFGAPYPAPGERGLLFLAYQTSIERQFEFITRAWLNNPNLREPGEGYDPIAGQNTDGHGERDRPFAIPVPGVDGTPARVSITLPDDWVVPTGGGYFFVPSLGALELIARGEG